MPEHPLATSPPTATVTFLFTDIEGSTRLWERDATRMSRALAAHDSLARDAVRGCSGTVVKMTGDGLCAVFDHPEDALRATLHLQRALDDPAATCDVPLRVRCGLHTGAGERRDNDYFGTAVNRAARIMSAAHGGQMLVSQALVDALGGVVPDPMALRDLGSVRLKDLATPERLYQVVDPQLRQVFPALRSLEATPNNLPQQTTSFVGRERELGELKRLFKSTRLLTLTGSGGCGKTRLCLHVAAEALDHFTDGVWLVELAALVNPELVEKTVATVLGVKEEAGRPIVETLVEHLRDRQAALILDNCEHLLDACAHVAETLLRRCPQVKLVASSREALGIAGEQAYRVPSLSAPDAKQPHTAASVARFEAVQLFAARATQVRTDFRVTDDNAATIASICARLDGIPLALELAAARVRSLSVEEINARLNQRFRLLTGGSRTALPRQQTLRSLIDWSYDLLNAPGRLLLQRLSVFAGGFVLQAAERICSDEDLEEGEVLDLLTSLCDKSLVAPQGGDGDSRFRLVETVRQYAREKLLEGASAERVRDRHLDFFLAVAEEAAPQLSGAHQTAWLRRLEAEHDNLRAALEWGVAQATAAPALRLCGALQRFWLTHGHGSEGRRWCAQALDASRAEPPSVARSDAMSGAGVLAYHQLDYAAARTWHEEALAMRRMLGHRRGIAVSLNNLAIVALDQGDLDTARAMHEESLAMARELGNRNGVARSLGNLGMVAAERGDFVTARALYEESLGLLRELGDRGGIAIGLHLLGDIASRQGDFIPARTYFCESLVILRELGHKARTLYTLEGLAAVLTALGNPAAGARMFGAAERLREETGAAAGKEDEGYGAAVRAVRSALSDDAVFNHAWQNGRALTMEQAVDAALAPARTP